MAEIPTFNQMQEAMQVIRRNSGPLPRAVAAMAEAALREWCAALHPHTPEAGADMFWWADDEGGPCTSPGEVVADIAEHGDQTDGTVAEVMRAAHRPTMFVAVRRDPETGEPAACWANTYAGAMAVIEGTPASGPAAPDQPAFARRDPEHLDPYGPNNPPVGGGA